MPEVIGFHVPVSLLAYLNVRPSQLTMPERRSLYGLYIIVSLFALHGSVKGFEKEGQYGNKINQIFTQQQCLTILATDLETFDGKSLDILPHFLAFCQSFFQILEPLP